MPPATESSCIMPGEARDTTRVALIGAGPCGLALMNAFKVAQMKDPQFKMPHIVCYEKQEEVSGLWNYTARTGTDKYGEPLHNSMYRYLWSNGPKECLEMSDYTLIEHFKKPIPSFPPRVVLRDYIMGRVKKNSVLQAFDIRLNTIVRYVEPKDEGNRFEVTSFDHVTKKSRVEEFDHLVVATGHYSFPHVPDYPGIDGFPGRVLHAHDFRDAREFAGQRVLIVGASYSAEDIASQLKKYGSKKVTCSYRSRAMGFEFPEGIEELPQLTHLEDNRVFFRADEKRGIKAESREIDAIIWCTGYQMLFPFLPDSLRLCAPNILFPNHLYKGVVWNDMPKACFMAMQDNYYTFSMFDAQAYYIRDYITGKIKLPPRVERTPEIERWYQEGQQLKSCYDDIDFQTKYVKDIMKYSDYPMFDFDKVVAHFYRWEQHKTDDIWTYRDYCFDSPCTGHMSTVHHTKWEHALDDTMEEFANTDKNGTRVGIIGMGPSGLALLNAFKQAQVKDPQFKMPHIVCYEKQEEVSGLWNYTARTGLDKCGEPLPNSMYRYLWSNGPKECLEMSDYTLVEHFKKPIPSFPPRVVLRDYFMGRVKKMNLLQEFEVRLETVVRKVDVLDNGNRFSIKSFDQKTKSTTVEEFDYIVIATGHYSVPHVPDYPGVDDFPGRVLHAHDFRDAREFAGQRVLLVGASYSAEDIAMQLKKYGSKMVTCSYRSTPMAFDFPEGIEELPQLTHLENNRVFLRADEKRGIAATYRDIDAIIWCTGYQMLFPFLPDSLRLCAPNILFPNHLYKGVVWNDIPKACFMGMQDNYYTYSMFDAQAYYIRDYITGKVELPPKEERSEEVKQWYEEGQKLETCYDDIDFQTKYVKDLMEYTDYPKFDIQKVVDHFYKWEGHKSTDIFTYRDKCFDSPCTGHMSPSHHTQWWQALDDTMEEFCRTDKKPLPTHAPKDNVSSGLKVIEDIAHNRAVR